MNNYSTVPKQMKEIMRNLNKQLSRIKGKTAQGAVEAVIIIMRDTEATPPITPVRYGNLRASRFVVTTGGQKFGETAPEFIGKTPSEKKKAAEMKSLHAITISTLKTQAGAKKTIERVYFGYSANYAAAVHEMVQSPSGKPINWSRPNSGPKWLEGAVKRNIPLIVETVAKYAKKR